jgi:sortase A
MARHSGTAIIDAPPPEPAVPVHRSWVDHVRTTLRGIGQTLITCGLVVLLFVFYEVYVTTWFTHREQTKLKHQLTQLWAQGQDPLALPGGKIAQLDAGKGIANIYIPRLGRDYAWTIVEGTSAADLDKGPGHYSPTALPGQIGNFAVAGHRVGKGEPFLNLDHLKPGDTVIIQTATTWYVYQVLGDASTGNLGGLTAVDQVGDKIPGREIISPDDSQVLEPVPDHVGATPTEHLMTMTTCHPKFTASHRMVVYAALEAQLTTTHAAQDQAMPAAIQALYNGVS